MPSLGRWRGSHQKQEACFGKHSVCVCVLKFIIFILLHGVFRNEDGEGVV